MVYFVSRWLFGREGHDLPWSIHYLWLDLVLIASTFLLFTLSGWTTKNIIVSSLVFYTLTISVTDFRHMIIPDILTISYAVIGIAPALMLDYITVGQALLGSLVGFALFWGIASLGSLAFKREALGGGDIKMAAMLGLFVGWQGVLMTLFLGSALALIYVIVSRITSGRSSTREVSFGPFLATAGTIILFVGDQLSAWYLQLL